MTRRDQWLSFTGNALRGAGLLFRGAIRGKMGDQLGATRDALDGVDALAEALVCLRGREPAEPPPRPTLVVAPSTPEAVEAALNQMVDDAYTKFLRAEEDE